MRRQPPRFTRTDTLLPYTPLYRSRYLPPKTTEDGKVKTQSGKTVDINSVELPVDALNKLNAEGTVDLAKLKIDGLKLNDIRLKLSGHGTQDRKSTRLNSSN